MYISYVFFIKCTTLNIFFLCGPIGSIGLQLLFLLLYWPMMIIFRVYRTLPSFWQPTALLLFFFHQPGNHDFSRPEPNNQYYSYAPLFIYG